MKKRTIVLLILIAGILAGLLAGCGESAENAPPRDAAVVPGFQELADGDDPLPTSYTLTKQPGNGEPQERIDNVVTLTAEQLAAPTPALSGHYFEAWYYNSAYTGARARAGDRLTADTTIYAKWVPTGTVNISTAEQLAAIAEAPDLNYRLVADIDLSGWSTLDPDYTPAEGEEPEKDRGWEPIGGIAEGEEFSGSFDGNNHTISGLNIRNLVQDEEFNFLPVGLFGKVTGTITRLNLEYTIDLPGDQSRFYIGGVAGWLDRGTVSDCTVVGKITNLGFEYEGNFWDQIAGSYAEPTTNAYIGGVVGFVEGGTVSRCIAEGAASDDDYYDIHSVSNESNNYLGGIAGVSDYYVETDQDGNVLSTVMPRISGSVSHMSVYGRYAGGLVGYNNGTLTTSFATGNVGASLAYPGIAGGLVAYNYYEGNISRAYATGNVSGRTAGGLVGVNIFEFEVGTGGTVSDAYAAGEVVGGEYAGGFAGRAVSNMPYEGRAGYADIVYDDSVEHASDIQNFFMIENCLSYGSVKIDVSEIVYTDYNGNPTTDAPDVFYSVFAGSFIGQAYELYIRNSATFGNVSATSNRPSDVTVDIGGETVSGEYNIAYANNFIGHSTSLVDTDDCYNVFAVAGIEVYRNGEKFDTEKGDGALGVNYNSVEEREDTDTVEFYTVTMDFDEDYWNFSRVEDGGMPTLMI